MADIKAQNSEAFLKRPPKDLTAILFYGADPGQVAERAGAFAKTLASDPGNPGEILRISDSDLAEDGDRLGVELRTVSMFGGRRIVRLQTETRLRPELFAGLLAPDIRLEGFLIVEAGDLKHDSKVKALFADAPNAAAVACSGDTASSLTDMIDAMVAEAGARIDVEARQALLTLLGADRALSRAEIDKLLTYVGAWAGTSGKSVMITEADVAAIVGDAAAQALDDVILATFRGDTSQAVKECDRAQGSGETAQSVMLALQRHVLRLAQLRSLLDQGRNADTAFRAMRPPLFGKARDVLAAQARDWSGRAVDRAVLLTQNAIAASRQTGAPDRELCEQLIMQLARLSQRP